MTIGIDAAEHDRIFERFHQIDQSSTRRFGGVGLGLYLARELVCDLGGEIAVESTPGGGSMFRVRIPDAGDSNGEAARGRGGRADRGRPGTVRLKRPLEPR